MIKPYEAKEIIIGEHTYTILAFKARDGLRIMKGLTKFFAKFKNSFAELIAKGIDGGIASIYDLDIKPAIDQFLNHLEDALEDDDFLPLIDQLVANTKCEGKPLTGEHFDLVFSRNYIDLAKLLKEVIAYNFFSQSFIEKMNEKKITK